jgi:hypothetical protein
VAGDNEEICVRRDHLRRNNVVVVIEANADYSPGLPTNGADLVFRETDCLPECCHEDHFIGSSCGSYPNKLVTCIQRHSDEPARADVGKLVEPDPFDPSLTGAEEEECRCAKISYW